MPVPTNCRECLNLLERALDGVFEGEEFSKVGEVTAAGPRSAHPLPIRKSPISELTA